MKLKTIRMNADRHARLKTHAKAAGFKTMGKYLESLLDQPIAPQGVPEEIIEQEVNRRIQEHRQRQTIESSARQRDMTEPEVLVGHGLQDSSGQMINTSLRPLPSVRALSHSVEDCARVMLDMLPEATRDFAHEVCEHILHIQPSQLIHGHLMNAADSGLLQSPHIDPSWEQRKVEEKAGKSICEWAECRQPFKPDHYGQRYCGNICGGKAATEMLPKQQVKTQPILDAPGMQNLIAV